jgi:hypothetical protein
MVASCRRLAELLPGPRSTAAHRTAVTVAAPFGYAPAPVVGHTCLSAAHISEAEVPTALGGTVDALS